MNLLPYVLLLLLCAACMSAQYCSYTATDGSEYDVSSLTLKDDAYSYNGLNNYKYTVNICGWLPTPCYSMKSSSCKATQAGTEWANGIYEGASFKDHPLGPNKGLQIIYFGGEKCAGTTRATTINIACDESTSGAIITSVEDNGGCNILVSMKAKAACPLVAQQCNYTASDGSKYNMSSLTLKNSQYAFTTSSNYNYNINVCGWLPTPCYGVKSSSCKISEFGTQWASGNYEGAKFRDHPLGPNKGVQIIYSEGEQCGGRARTTTINIACSHIVQEATITTVLDAGGCDITIEMQAKAACPDSLPVKQCNYTASDGSKYDVSSLALKNDQYTFTKGVYLYTLNVCGWLFQPCYGMEQSSCKRSEFGTEWASGVYENTMFSDHPLGPNKGLQMKYIHGGEPCGPITRSTTINIVCDAATAGGKVTDVMDDNGCNIQVEMKASAACPTKFIQAHKH